MCRYKRRLHLNRYLKKNFNKNRAEKFFGYIKRTSEIEVGDCAEKHSRGKIRKHPARAYYAFSVHIIIKS